MPALDRCLALLLCACASAAQAGDPPIYGDTGQRITLTTAPLYPTVNGALTVDLDGGRPDLVLWGFFTVHAYRNAGSSGPEPWFVAGPQVDLGGNVLDVISIRLDADPEPELLALVQFNLGEGNTRNDLLRLDYIQGPTPALVVSGTLRSDIPQARRLATPFGNDRAMPLAVLRSGAPHLLLEQRFGSSGVQSLEAIPIDLGNFNALGAVSAYIDGDARPDLLIFGPGGLRLYSDRIPPLLGSIEEIPTPGFEGPLAIGLAARGAAVDIGVGKMGTDAILLHDPQISPLGALSWSDAGLSLGVLPTNAVLSLDANQDGYNDLLFIREGQNSLIQGTGSSLLPYGPDPLNFGSGGRDATFGGYLAEGVNDLVIVNANGEAELWRARERRVQVQLRLSDGPPLFNHVFGSSTSSPIRAMLSPSGLPADLTATIAAECTDLSGASPQALPAQSAVMTIPQGALESAELPLPPPQVNLSECRYSITEVAFAGAEPPALPERPGLARYAGRIPGGVGVCREEIVGAGCVACFLTSCLPRTICTGTTQNQTVQTPPPTAPAGPDNEWQPAIVELPRRLRDELMQNSAGGRHYIDRYYSYGALALEAGRLDPLQVTEVGQRVLYASAALISDLLDGDGSAPIPATLVADTQALYDLARAQADAAVGDAMDADWALLDLQAFSGQSVASFASHVATLAPDPLFADSFEPTP